MHKSDIASLFALACIEKKVLYIPDSPPSSLPSTSTSLPTEEGGKEREKEKEIGKERSFSSALSSELLRSTGIIDQSQFSPLRVLLENMYPQFKNLNFFDQKL
jgi:hypothetical protein